MHAPNRLLSFQTELFIANTNTGFIEIASEAARPGRDASEHGEKTTICVAARGNIK